MLPDALFWYYTFCNVQELRNAFFFSALLVFQDVVDKLLQDVYVAYRNVKQLTVFP